MDQIQETILRELQTNARATNRVLSARAGLAPSSTSARVRDLEKSGVIKGYHADVDLAALGRPLEAMVFVKLSPTDEVTVQRFFRTVAAMPETISVHLVSGVEDALVHVAVPDVRWLRDTVLGRISSLDEVADERTSLIFGHVRNHAIEPLGEL